LRTGLNRAGVSCVRSGRRSRGVSPRGLRRVDSHQLFVGTVVRLDGRQWIGRRPRRHSRDSRNLRRRIGLTGAAVCKPAAWPLRQYIVRCCQGVLEDRITVCRCVWPPDAALARSGASAAGDISVLGCGGSPEESTGVAKLCQSRRTWLRVRGQTTARRPWHAKAARLERRDGSGHAACGIRRIGAPAGCGSVSACAAAVRTIG